jgi:hypothetical protein
MAEAKIISSLANNTNALGALHKRLSGDQWTPLALVI